ncbi:glycosyltransferase family 4 protein [Flavobacterium sp.]|uniref:glycosyltransferase family 4 protein n=1 Tax=Flavobacterium sp. TaxID=239 RepID=UPI002622295A|nr:glycosyltransferase family 4 protein [Flavobacterium sp.]MDD3004341.1 glycosyltransferase family 4 protein [Flavobacterium sp.]
MKNILIINQSSELYGSDKALLELIENFPKDYNPIVVLEHEGPLKEIFLQQGIQVIKCPVIKLHKSIFCFSGIFKLLTDFFKGIYILRKETKNLKIDIVHSNAISVLVGAFYSFIFRKKHLWHVHEIIENPKVIANFYPKLVSFFSHKIIYNSRASYEQFLKIKPSISSKSEVVYNGQNRLVPFSSKEEVDKIKNTLFKAKDQTIIGLVGRINQWKGQYILLDAFYNLHKKFPTSHLVFVGSAPPEQDHYLDKLEKMIKDYQLENRVTIIDFQTNIWPIYDAIDISVVPSIQPEPFGLVATEAMLSKNPVVASNHGGLSEILIDNVTGFYVEPRNQKDLENKLEILLNDPELAKKMGIEGNKRVKECFSTSQYVKAIENVYNSL